MSPRGLGALAASVVLVAACGGTKVKVLDSLATGRQIADHLTSIYGVAEPAVDCPTGVKVSAGKTFDCSTALDGQPLTVHVTLTDEQGHLTVSPAAAVVVVAKIAAAIQSAEAKATVRCGPHTVLVEQPGATFDCMAATAAGPVTYRVTVQDLAGHVRYQPVAAQAG
jgi:Domain of unknown function (DUF4333)